MTDRMLGPTTCLEDKSIPLNVPPKDTTSESPASSSYHPFVLCAKQGS